MFHLHVIVEDTGDFLLFARPIRSCGSFQLHFCIRGASQTILGIFIYRIEADTRKEPMYVPKLSLNASKRVLG